MEFLYKLKVEHNIILNPQQEKAVLTIEGANLLLAVPGSGKTTVIILRIGNMLYNLAIDPEEILALTFSVAAANDMKKRFLSIFGDKFIKELNFKTIHSFCYQVIKDYEKLKNTKAFSVCEDNSHIIKQIYLELNNEYIGEDILREITRKITYCKNMMLKKSDIESISIAGCDFGEIYRAYESYKIKNRLMDYDDMLTYSYHILRQNKSILDNIKNRFKYFNVDEAQDISVIQHEIIKLLVGSDGNIFMVGDEDQSIYGFRGAYPKALLDFEKAYKNSKVLLMQQNYRSTMSVVNAADSFIKQNKSRYDKSMFCVNEEGPKIKRRNLIDLKDQYEYIAELIKKEKKDNKKTSIGVLFRNNESVIPIIDTLLRENISFSVRENRSGFFSHFILEDIKAYCQFAKDFGDIDAFEKIYFKLDCYISKQMFDYVKANFRGNVFNTLLDFPGLYDSNIKMILQRREDFEKLRSLKADEVIGFIERDMGYVDSINNLAGKGFVKESLLQKLSVLRTIGASLGEGCTAEDIFRRLEVIEEIMGSSDVRLMDGSVTLSTVHSSKGLEFDKVILVDMIDGQFPSRESIKLRDEGSDLSFYEEEVRLFYVAVTRARRDLLIICSSVFNGRLVRVSQFVSELLNGPIVVDGAGAGDSVSDVVAEVMKSFVVGVGVVHNRFGEGVVRERIDDVVVVDFHGLGLKRLLLEDCVRNGYLEVFTN
ncbi:MAG: DNA helicase II / ATP-dependent DNA helicase PcrA [Fusobacteria bacterium]|nr:MAG: DNA helicase II / ATP-dependent DNA helicase PcrA [Fusobacteriota bacterium]KAF0230254.1 MAG: DNA helicase II / ATP-dependent DNA helicase [Fusobacteriota bacterium]